MRELIVDSFAGGGGASLGISWALGRGPDIAINHDAEALAMHEANHPETQHLINNIWQVDPIDATGRQPVGLAWFSPDCFPAGTLILTSTGLKPIETITVGELVMTHRARWRAVTNTSSKVAETITLKGHGHYGLVTTPDHPFYSKQVTKRYPGKRGFEDKRPGMLRTLVENPHWPIAERMVGKLWATPRVFPSSGIPTCAGAEFSEGFFYFLGRWIGDGSVSKGDVSICCGSHEMEAFKRQLELQPIKRGNGETIQFRCSDQGSTHNFTWGNTYLADWLRTEFGDSCESKHLPPWCLSMQANWRRALLKGYLDADGHRCVRTEACSISRSLAIGIRLLAISLGYAAAFYHSPGRPCRIEGRSYIGKDIYRVAWREELQRETVFWDGKHLFSPVREVTPTGVKQRVFCLEVAEDESYVADGIVVHNCTHFSRAKGGKPVSRGRRDLAWVIVHWAKRVRPRVICMENVGEWLDWGPLTEESRPCPERKGETFERWAAELRRLGYRVEWRELRACDYGAPTIRKRLFLIARRDGLPIVWPEPTHGPGRLPYRTAADIIDWTLDCPSIFLTKEEGRAVGANRPLAEATMARIAKGVQRYVIESENPFIVPTEDGPVAPFATYGQQGGRNRAVTDPFHTFTASRKDCNSLVTAHLTKFSENSIGERPDVPLHTVMAGAPRHGVVAAFLAQHNAGSWNNQSGRSAAEPVSTITQTGSQQAIVAAHLGKASEGRAEEVRAFLIRYYGSGGQFADPRDPMHTIPTHDRFGLVTVHGTVYRIVDIGMRMLTPRELFRAQGFPDSYVIDRGPYGTPLTKTASIRMCGNSVCPHVAEAIVAANYSENQIPASRRVRPAAPLPLFETGDAA